MMFRIGVFVLAFLISYVLSRFFAGRVGGSASYRIFPREESPFHKDKKEILKVGGIIIFASVILALYIAASCRIGLEIIAFDLKKVIGLVVGSVIIFLLGIYDDTRKLNYKRKFLWQFAATIPILISGYNISAVSFFGKSLEIYAIGYFLMVFWIILITNAINLIDGLDGLAAGVGIITFSALAVISHSFYPAVSILCLAFIGGLLAFLKYNFYPARLFLGDNGSLLLGFVLAVLSLESNIKMNTLTALSLPILILIVPIGSAAYSFIRRVSKGKDPFVADRLHLHYLLLNSGLPHRVVVVLFWFSTLILTMLGVISYFLDRRFELFILASGVVMLVVSYAVAIVFISKKRLKRDA